MAILLTQFSVYIISQWSEEKNSHESTGYIRYIPVKIDHNNHCLQKIPGTSFCVVKVIGQPILLDQGGNKNFNPLPCHCHLVYITKKWFYLALFKYAYDNVSDESQQYIKSSSIFFLFTYGLHSVSLNR